MSDGADCDLFTIICFIICLALALAFFPVILVCCIVYFFTPYGDTMKRCMGNNEVDPTTEEEPEIVAETEEKYWYTNNVRLLTKKWSLAGNVYIILFLNSNLYARLCHYIKDISIENILAMKLDSQLLILKQNCWYQRERTSSLRPVSGCSVSASDSVERYVFT